VINYYADAMNYWTSNYKLEKQKILPDLNLSLFRGMNKGVGRQTYSGFHVGVALPLWFGYQKSKIEAAKTQTKIISSARNNYLIQLRSKYDALLSDLRQFEKELIYYEETGKKLSEETLFHANKAYQNGEINFLQYTQFLENSKTIESNYLHYLFKYNETVLEANYLMIYK
jgi:cobalt-zinc-cadmium resistance protein CzcA